VYFEKIQRKATRLKCLRRKQKQEEDGGMAPLSSILPHAQGYLGMPP